VGVLDEPKIDCHNHVFDPRRFPYAPDAYYLPAGQEVGRPDQLGRVFDAYGVRHAVLVGPNSGYGEDHNDCLLDTVERAGGRYRGIAVVSTGVTRARLERLRAAGIVGITFNVALLGVDHYRDTGGLLATLRDLDLFVDVQVTGDQLVELAPLLAGSGARILVDHCGLPEVAAGVGQSGFQALLDWGGSGRVHVKLSGHYKFSQQDYPYRDTWPFISALLAAYGPQGCVWGSDWPFLRAEARLDYGPLVTLVERLVPDPDARSRILWETPRRLFGFPA
jgi:predicted TIM-barrel fold metal-dependent hydrolase